MGKIYVRTQDVRSQASELETLRQQHLAVMKELRILVMSLSDDWQGEAQNAFVNAFLTKSKEISNFDTLIAQYVSTINKVADESERVDKNLRNKLQSMS